MGAGSSTQDPKKTMVTIDRTSALLTRTDLMPIKSSIFCKPCHWNWSLVLSSWIRSYASCVLSNIACSDILMLTGWFNIYWDCFSGHFWGKVISVRLSPTNGQLIWKRCAYSRGMTHQQAPRCALQQSSLYL